MTMSLDGFVADENDGVGELFGWYGNGDVEIRTANPGMTLHVTEASAAHVRPAFGGGIGALLAGRRLWEVAGGWGGTHPVGAPVFVVSGTMRGENVFADPMEALAAARQAAGDRDVAVATPTLTRHYLAAGVLDEIVVSLVPVLLGRGIRFFDDVPGPPVRLSDPVVVEGRRVTHLTYRVLRD